MTIKNSSLSLSPLKLVRIGARFSGLKLDALRRNSSKSKVSSPHFLLIAVIYLTFLQYLGYFSFTSAMSVFSSFRIEKKANFLTARDLYRGNMIKAFQHFHSSSNQCSTFKNQALLRMKWQANKQGYNSHLLTTSFYLNMKKDMKVSATVSTSSLHDDKKRAGAL